MKKISLAGGGYTLKTFPDEKLYLAAGGSTRPVELRGHQEIRFVCGAARADRAVHTNAAGGAGGEGTGHLTGGPSIQTAGALVYTCARVLGLELDHFLRA